VLKRFFASLGVGSAKIDLILDSHSVVMGEKATGKIVLKGGEAEQRIDGLTVHFRLTSTYQKGDHTRYVNETVSSIPVTEESFTVRPGETREYPFSFTCPTYLPVSSVSTRYFFQTHLEIEKGLDSADRDYVEVHPNGLLKNFLDGFKHLGFVHYREGYTGVNDGAWQIIQFHPTTLFRGEYDEVVFMFQPRNTLSGVSGFFELDKKTCGLLGMLADELDLDEKKGRFRFSAAELATPETAAETIKRFIIRHSEGLIGG
jgi:sporulation-control protein